ncbi:hypothetical protein LQZ18_07305 [Lachnospiraceae bacterium ZAX-1]
MIHQYKIKINTWNGNIILTKLYMNDNVRSRSLTTESKAIKDSELVFAYDKETGL